MARGKSGSRGRGAPAGDPQAAFQRAVADYEAGRYRQARKALAPLLQLPDRDGYVTLLAGLVDASLGDWKAAGKRLASATELLPQRVEAWMGLGNARYALGDPEAAIHAYQRAVELQPGSAAAWNNLGLAHADMRRDHDALACFEHALAAAPDYDAARRGRAESLARIGRLDDALAAHDALIERFPDDAALALDRAELLERANRADEARTALAGLPELRQPGLIARREALRGRLQAREGDLGGALDAVRTARRRTREDWLGYLEGNLLDRQGDAAGAVEAFRHANAARARLRPVRRLQAQDAPGYLDHKLARGIESCDRAQPAAAERTPIFIVGLPRSGTTLLDRMLAAHPGVQVLEEPESLRVAEAAVAAGGDAARARARYWDWLEQTLGLEPGRTVIDKNPLHALHLDLLPSLFPHATVICSLRHPFDAALSCWMQDFALNAVTVHFLELESTAAMCARLLGMMRLYEQACPANVQRIHYEELVSGDFRAPVERLLEAIGLTWHPDMERFAEKASGSGLIRSASYEQVTRGIYSSAVERWRRYDEWLGPFRETLGPSLEYWRYSE